MNLQNIFYLYPINLFEDKKIQTRTYFAGNIILQKAYTHLMDPKKVIEDYPVARKITTDTFFLGTSPVITDTQIEYISSIVEEFFEKFFPS